MEIRDKDLCFLVHTLEFEALNFLHPPKISLCPPPPPVTLSWRRAWKSSAQKLKHISRKYKNLARNFNCNLIAEMGSKKWEKTQFYPFDLS